MKVEKKKEKNPSVTILCRKCTPEGLTYRWQKRLKPGKFWHWLREGRKLAMFYSGKMFYVRGMENFRISSSKSSQWTGGRD